MASWLLSLLLGVLLLASMRGYYIDIDADGQVEVGLMTEELVVVLTGGAPHTNNKHAISNYIVRERIWESI